MGNELPDIRRFINTNTRRKIAGSDMIEAVKKLGDKYDDCKYVERVISDINGNVIFMVGIESPSVSRCVMVRTGDDLEDIGINADEDYKEIGIGSSNELIPEATHAVYYEDGGYRNSLNFIEKVVDGIEKILD